MVYIKLKKNKTMPGWTQNNKHACIFYVMCQVSHIETPGPPCLHAQLYMYILTITQSKTQTNILICLLIGPLWFVYLNEQNLNINIQYIDVFHANSACQHQRDYIHVLTQHRILVSINGTYYAMGIRIF